MLRGLRVKLNEQIRIYMNEQNFFFFIVFIFTSICALHMCIFHYKQ